MHLVGRTLEINRITLQIYYKIRCCFVAIEMPKAFETETGMFSLCHSVLQLCILVKLVEFLHCRAIKILKTFKKSKKKNPDISTNLKTCPGRNVWVEKGGHVRVKEEVW